MRRRRGGTGLRSALGWAVAAIALATTARAQPRAGEWAGRLSVPRPSGAAVLEMGVGLSRPAPPRGAVTVATPPVTGPLRVESVATASRPLGVAFGMEGELAADLRSILSTDLAYVRAVSLSDDGEMVLGGTGTLDGDGARVELTLRWRDRPGGGALTARYAGPRDGLARFVHGFADDVTETLTGRRSAFRSRLLFARRLGPGRKQIVAVDADGRNVEKVTDGEAIATLPSFGRDDIWYSVVTPTGVFITRRHAQGRPIIGGPGTHMGITTCGDRLFFASSRGGNTDIWSAALDGSGQRRLTVDGGIDVSPTCTPDGRIAFVSDRTGSPQVWVMDADGNHAEQLTDTPHGAQTPSWCGDLVAFTGVGGGRPMRVAVLDTRSGRVHRVSPGGGTYKDPVFSPDCRMLAWVSPEGVEIATPDGRLRRLVVPGHAETLRWARLPR